MRVSFELQEDGTFLLDCTDRNALDSFIKDLQKPRTKKRVGNSVVTPKTVQLQQRKENVFYCRR